MIETGIYAEENTASPPAASLKLEKKEDQNVFKGTLYKIWHKLRTLNPVNHAQSAPPKQVIATAGIRGAETTDSLLQLYWKDDRTNDDIFLNEISILNSAQILIESGQMVEGKKALEQFLAQYPGSDLKPNALFTIALVTSSLGDIQQGTEIFKQFIQEYPDHPLKMEAENAIKTFTL